MITDRIGRHEVFLSINQKNYNFREKNSQVMKERENTEKRRRKLFNVALKLRLADFNYNFENDWLLELSDNKGTFSRNLFYVIRYSGLILGIHFFSRKKEASD